MMRARSPCLILMVLWAVKSTGTGKSSGVSPRIMKSAVPQLILVWWFSLVSKLTVSPLNLETSPRRRFAGRVVLPLFSTSASMEVVILSSRSVVVKVSLLFSASIMTFARTGRVVLLPMMLQTFWSAFSRSSLFTLIFIVVPRFCCMLIIYLCISFLYIITIIAVNSVYKSGNQTQIKYFSTCWENVLNLWRSGVLFTSPKFSIIT